MTAKTKAGIKKNVVGYLYIMPVLLGILIFTVLPVLYALISSFFKTPLKPFSLTEWGEFVGFENYIQNFTTFAYRYYFLRSLKVTFIYAAINIPLTMVLGFALALLLNKKMRGMKFFRTLYYLPVLIPAVCGGMVWNRMTNVHQGILNGMLSRIGLPTLSWFSKAETSMASFIFVGLFQLGGNMILWLAQLKNVPASLYESARLDGAGKLRQVFAVTIPVCSPMILYNVIISVIGVMQTYAQVVTLTGGAGEAYSLLFYVMNIYRYNVTEFGYACALSFILFLIIAALTAVVMKTSKWVYYGEEA